MTDKYKDRPYHVAMFVSRNKDNKNVENFKQRSYSFLTQKYAEELKREFGNFANQGVQGEMSRFYMSVNERKIEVIRKSLLHYLIDHEDTSLTNLDKLVASLATKKGTALTQKWLFDYDWDEDMIDFFIGSLELEGVKNEEVSLTKTPNGYAIVTEHGFDTRQLLSHWKSVELKRDGMLFIGDMTKE